MFEPGLVYVTAPNQEVATALSQFIVRERLAACVSMHSVNSVYMWEGKEHSEAEVQLVLKTNIANFHHIASRIKERHPYEVPEIVAIPIAHASEPYVNWIKEHTL
jgi:periplasmic divalent cation tolerance protein